MPLKKSDVSLTLLCMLALGSFAFSAGLPQRGAAEFKDVEYIFKPPGQEKGKAVKGVLAFDSGAKAIRFNSKGGAQFDIPYTRVSGLLYERTSKPRYGLGLLVAWPLLFTKSKKHYLTIQYKQPDGQGQFAILHLDKGHFQEILATAEAQTRLKVERTEER